MNSVLIGCEGGEIIDFDFIDMKVLKQFNDGGENVTGVLTVNDKIITSSLGDSKVKTYDNNLESTDPLHELEYMCPSSVKYIHNNTIAFISNIESLVLYDIEKNKILNATSRYDDFTPTMLSKATNNICLVVSYYSGEIFTWNMKSNKITSRIKANNNRSVYYLHLMQLKLIMRLMASQNYQNIQMNLLLLRARGISNYGLLKGE